MRVGRSGVAIVVAWLVVAAIGWLTSSLALTVCAPLLLLALPALLLRDRSRARPINALALGAPTIVLFAFAYLVVPSLAALQPRRFASVPGYLDSPPWQHQLACVLVGFAFIALIAGYQSETARRIGARAQGAFPAPLRQRELVAGLLGASFFIAGTLAVVAAVLLATTPLSIGNLFSSELRDDVVRQFKGRGYLSIGFMLLMLSAPCFALWASLRRTVTSWVICLGLSLVAAAELGALTGSRIGVVAVVLGVLVVVHYRVRRVPTAVVVALGLVLAGIGVAQGVVRGTSVIENPLSPAATLAATLDGFNFLVNALARVRDFEFGRTLAEDIGLTYLPRDLWPDKPTVFGFVRAQEAVAPGLFQDLGSGEATFPVGLVAEGYVNFGMFGVVGMPLIAGACLRAMQAAIERSNSDWWVLLGAWALPNSVSLMRGFGTTVITIAIGAVLLLPVALVPRGELRRRRWREARGATGARAPGASARASESSTA